MRFLNYQIHPVNVANTYASRGIDFKDKVYESERKRDFYELLQGIIGESDLKYQTGAKLQNEEKYNVTMSDKQLGNSDHLKRLETKGREVAKGKNTENEAVTGKYNIEKNSSKDNVYTEKSNIGTGRNGKSTSGAISEVLLREVKNTGRQVGKRSLDIAGKPHSQGLLEEILREKISFRKLSSMKMKSRKTLIGNAYKKTEEGVSSRHRRIINRGIINKKILNERSLHRKAFLGELLADRLFREKSIKNKTELIGSKKNKKDSVSRKNHIEGVGKNSSRLKAANTAVLRNNESLDATNPLRNRENTGENIIGFKDHLRDYTDRLKTTEGLKDTGNVFSNTNLEKADEVFRDIVQRFNFLVKRGGGEAHISLKPDLLGKLYMKISVNHHSVDALFLVENEAIRELLLQRIASLEQGLGQHGLSLGSFNVEVGEENGWKNAENGREAESIRGVTGIGAADESDEIIDADEVEGVSARYVPWIATKIDLEV